MSGVHSPECGLLFGSTSYSRIQAKNVPQTRITTPINIYTDRGSSSLKLIARSTHHVFPVEPWALYMPRKPGNKKRTDATPSDKDDFVYVLFDFVLSVLLWYRIFTTSPPPLTIFAGDRFLHLPKHVPVTGSIVAQPPWYEGKKMVRGLHHHSNSYSSLFTVYTYKPQKTTSQPALSISWKTHKLWIKAVMK